MKYLLDVELDLTLQDDNIQHVSYKNLETTQETIAALKTWFKAFLEQVCKSVNAKAYTGVVTSLRRVDEVTVVENKQFNGTYVVTGELQLILE